MRNVLSQALLPVFHLLLRLCSHQSRLCVCVCVCALGSKRLESVQARLRAREESEEAAQKERKPNRHRVGKRATDSKPSSWTLRTRGQLAFNLCRTRHSTP